MMKSVEILSSLLFRGPHCRLSGKLLAVCNELVINVVVVNVVVALSMSQLYCQIKKREEKKTKSEITSP
jgi:hypothetical protein